jgi:aryl-alcohol dehydrogenase-like predicted oxidoreductase
LHPISHLTPAQVYFPLHKSITTRKQVAGETVDYVNQHGLSRKNIFASVKDSLKRLDMEYIDLLQCHR